MNRFNGKKCNILPAPTNDYMLLNMNRLNDKKCNILAHKSVCMLVYIKLKL